LTDLLLTILLTVFNVAYLVNLLLSILLTVFNVAYLTDLLPMESVPITTIVVVSSNPAHGDVHSIQHYVIKIVSDLQQVNGFLWVLRFARPCFLADIQVFFLHQYIDSSDITKEAPSKGVQIFRNGRSLVMRDE
jgi:hypothetical protein